MDAKCTRRESFLFILGGIIAGPRIVSLIVGSLASFFLASCGRDPRKPSSSNSASVTIVSGASLETALRKKTSLATRPTQWGEEVVQFGTWNATKGTKTDDGFVFLVNGSTLGGPSSDHPIFGTSTIEVRHVPHGVKGEHGTPILFFDAVTT